ncbi:ABC transporter substrate-binding protein [Brachybacterium sp. EF45031]|nr:ABC transporter substrate-binding protein [Brachybacterium sillae]
MTRRQLSTLVLGTLGAGTLAACSGGAQTGAAGGSGSGAGASDAGADGAAPGATVEDNFGQVQVPASPQRVVLTDSRVFRTAEAWGIAPVAVPKPIVPKGVAYKTDDEIIDLGSHREPNLEAFVEAAPDLVVTGGRFAGLREKILPLVGEAAVVDVTPRDDQPVADELRRSTTVFGQIFGKQAEAEKLIADFDAAIERATQAYDGTSPVMGLITSGGDIAYVAPGTPRNVGPIFDMVGLTPAIDKPAEDAAHGDDISVEAIVQAAPEWLLVMDRDAAITASEEPGYRPAQQLIESNPALASVPAVAKGQVVYMPATFYTTEDIQAYTEILGSLADAMSA